MAIKLTTTVSCRLSSILASMNRSYLQDDSSDDDPRVLTLLATELPPLDNAITGDEVYKRIKNELWHIQDVNRNKHDIEQSPIKVLNKTLNIIWSGGRLRAWRICEAFIRIYQKDQGVNIDNLAEVAVSIDFLNDDEEYEDNERDTCSCKFAAAAIAALVAPKSMKTLIASDRFVNNAAYYQSHLTSVNLDDVVDAAINAAQNEGKTTFIMVYFGDVAVGVDPADSDYGELWMDDSTIHDRFCFGDHMFMLGMDPEGWYLWQAFSGGSGGHSYTLDMYMKSIYFRRRTWAEMDDFVADFKFITDFGNGWTPRHTELYLKWFLIGKYKYEDAEYTGLHWKPSVYTFVFEDVQLHHLHKFRWKLSDDGPLLLEPARRRPRQSNDKESPPEADVESPDQADRVGNLIRSRNRATLQSYGGGKGKAREQTTDVPARPMAIPRPSGKKGTGGGGRDWQDDGRPFRTHNDIEVSKKKSTRGENPNWQDEGRPFRTDRDIEAGVEGGTEKSSPEGSRDTSGRERTGVRKLLLKMKRSAISVKDRLT